MDLGIAGRVALVGGATSGLGLASARGLAAEGVRVAMVGRRGELLDELVAGIDGAIGIAADLTLAADRERVVAEVRERLGEIDILVANGGGPAPSSARDIDLAGVDAASELLVKPAVDLVNAVLPSMLERGWGRIIAIGSSGIQSPLPNLAASNLGRSALAAYLKTLSTEVADSAVTVNMVLPGRIDTPRLKGLAENTAAATGVTVAEARAASEAEVPAGRYGSPEEFGQVVTFLAGQGAAYVTGEQIRVDGGLVAGY